MKFKQNMNFVNLGPYYPYDCDEETNTLLILSHPIQIFRVATTLCAIFCLCLHLIKTWPLHIFTIKGPLILSILMAGLSLLNTWEPVKIIITPDSISMIYMLFFFKITKRISKTEICYVVLSPKRKMALWHRVNISLVNSNQKEVNLFACSGKDQASMFEQANRVLKTVANILGIISKPYLPPNQALKLTE
jgi:hypothetical protein